MYRGRIFFLTTGFHCDTRHVYAVHTDYGLGRAQAAENAENRHATLKKNRVDAGCYRL